MSTINLYFKYLVDITLQYIYYVMSTITKKDNMEKQPVEKFTIVTPSQDWVIESLLSVGYKLFRVETYKQDGLTYKKVEMTKPQPPNED